MNQLVRKYLKKIDFSIIIIVVLFALILSGPYLLAKFNKQTEESQSVINNTPPAVQTDPIEVDRSPAASRDSDLTQPAEAATEPSQSQEATDDQLLAGSNNINENIPAYQTHDDQIAYSPETNETPVTLPDHFEVNDDFVAPEVDTEPETPIVIDETPVWKKSVYQYQDNTIKVDFGDKTENQTKPIPTNNPSAVNNNQTKVVYQAPVWANYDGTILKTISNWFDKITNQNIKSIEFSLVGAYDSAKETGPATYDKAYQPSSFWDELKNFFTLIYQNNPKNLEIAQENGQDIVVNKSVLEGINVQYQILPNRGIKEEIEVTNNNYLKDNFVFKLVMEDGVKYQRNSDYLVDAPADVYYFTDSAGNYIAHFIPLVAYDMKGNKTENVSMSIKPIDSQTHQITVTVDHAWLFSKDRQFPVVVDPSIVHDTQTEFDTAKSLNRVTTTSDPKIQLSGPPYNNYGVYTSDVLDLGSSNPLLDTISWTENGVQTGDGETDLTSAGLVAKWNFNETSGTTLNDTSGNSLNGTLYNMVTSGQDASYTSGWTANKKKWGTGALMFDGSNDYLTVPHSANFNLTSAWTVAAWVKRDGDSTNNSDGSSTWKVIARKGIFNTFILHTDKNTWKTSAGIYNGSSFVATASTSALDIGQWHYIVGTYENVNSGTLKIYFDGKLENTLTGIGTPVTNSDPVYIGGGNNISGVATYWPVTLDTTSIYNRALTNNEIISNYQTANIEFQTRTGSDSNPYDGGWEDWKPAGSGTETSIDNLDNGYLYSTGESNLVGYWPMDETSGTNVDDPVNNNDGTATGTTIIDGKYSKARSFNGTSDELYVLDSNSLDMTNSITLEAWIYPKDLTGQHFILEKRWLNNVESNYYFRTNGSNLSFGFYNGAWYGYNSSQTLSLNQWNHVAVTYNRTNVIFYVNGIKDTPISQTLAMIPSAGPLVIGRAQDSTAYRYFNGYIDELKIFNTAQTDTKIISDYLTGIDRLGISPCIIQKSDAVTKIEGTKSEKIVTGQSKVDANTVALWHLNETGGSGAYLKDSSGNSNDLNSYSSSSVVAKNSYGRSLAGNTSSYLAKSGMTNFPTGNLTIELWVKTTDNDAGIVSYASSTYDNDFLLYLAAPNLRVFHSTTSYVDTGITLHDGQWHHLAVTWETSGAVKAYKDGIQAYSGTLAAGSTNTSGGTLVIGQEQDSVGGGFDGTQALAGSVDEIKISDTVRSADEIYESYRLGRDHLINKSISTTDLSAKTKLPFYVASDQPGQKLDLTIGESAFANYQPDANTVGLWHLEESTGTGAFIKDSSGSVNNLTPSGTTATDGLLGMGKSFNGTSNYLLGSNTTSSNFGTGDFSVEFWAKPTSPLTDRTYATNLAAAGTWGDGWIIQTSSAGLRFITRSNTTDNSGQETIYSPSLAANVWNHVTLVRNGLTQRIYINGQEVASNTGSVIQNVNTSTPINIGRDPLNGRYYSGVLDEIRTYNIARTPEEIRQAYEIGKRTHQVTFDFAASLDSGNLIAGSGDVSFTVDATAKGLSSKGAGLYVGDKIIVRENYDGTEYIAQGTVDAVNQTTGAVTVTSWDAGSTFPVAPGGYGQYADVFKWQREYFDLTGVTDSHIDAVNQITLRPKNGTTGNTFWIDDIESVSNYLTNPAGSTIQSSDNQYIQYRAIFNTNDSNITPSISNVTINFNNAPDPSFTSAVTSQSSLNNNNKTAFNLQCVGVTVYTTGTTECQASWDNTNWNTIGSVTGSQNNTTIQGAPDVSVWTGYPADGNRTMYVRIYVNSTAYSNTTLNITKDTLSPSISLINSVAGDTSAPYIDTTDDGSTVVSFVSAPDTQTCKWSTTDIDYDSMANACSSVSSCALDLVGSGGHTVYLRCLDEHTNKAMNSYQINYSILWNGYSKLIEFDQPTPTSDYQIMIDLNAGNFNYANAKSAGEDIRFTDVENNQLSYWIQEWNSSGTSKVWVKVPDSGTKYIKMHYGNPSAIDNSDGNNTFVFFDDFNDGVIDNTKWTRYLYDSTGQDSTLTEYGGNAVIFNHYLASTKTALLSIPTFNKNYVLESRASINYGGGSSGVFGWGVDFPHPAQESWLLFSDESVSDTNIYLKHYVGSYLNQYVSVNGGVNVFHNYKIRWKNGLMAWYLDDSLLREYVANPYYLLNYNYIPSSNMRIGFGSENTQNTSNEYHYMDWVFVRKDNTNDLVASIANENILNTNDTTAPTVTSVTSVEGDTTNTWTDTGDNDTTTITMNTPIDTAYCKWDAVDTDYDSMSGLCEDTSTCTVDSTSEGTYNFYIRCMDFSGNKATTSKTVEVIVDYFWGYSRELTLNAPTTMSNQQVRLDFTAANFDYTHIKSDGSDIRFTDTFGTFLDYWIEEWNDGGNSKVWVEIPTIGTDTIKILYGNSLHIDRSDGENTFLFFDGFSGSSLDTNKWSQYDKPPNSYWLSTVTVANGLLDIYVPTSSVNTIGSYVIAKSSFGKNTAIEMKGSNHDSMGYGSYWTRYDGYVSESIDFNYDATNALTYFNVCSSEGGIGCRSLSSMSLSLGSYHNYRITRPTGNPSYYVDDVYKYTYTYSTPPQGNLPPTFDLRSANSNSGHTYIDWVFVRNYSGSELTFQTLGAEQSNQTVFPRVNAITSVAGDTAAPYVDVTDDSNTLVIFTTLDNPTTIRWDESDTDYDSMTHTCASLTQCTLDLTGDGLKTVYFRATDALGNKSTSSFQLQYTISQTILSDTLSSSMPSEPDLTMVVSVIPAFSEPITDGSIKLIFADEFDFSGLTRSDVSASGGDVTWTDDEVIYAGGTQIAYQPSWFYDIAYAQGENSITFNFTGDLSSEDGEITFTIGGLNLPGNPPTEGPYSYIIEWYNTHNASGSPLYIKDGKVYINEGTVVSASIPTAFSFTIAPVGSGSVNGASITQSTSVGTAVNFGTYTGDADRIAAHDLIVSSNATGGYNITVQYTGQLVSDSDHMYDFTGSNATPTTWATPPGSGITSYFGYTTDDDSLSDTPYDRFTSSGGNKWAAFTTSPAEIVYFTGPANDQTNRIGYRLDINSLQPAGIYTTNITYIATPTF